MHTAMKTQALFPLFSGALVKDSTVSYFNVAVLFALENCFLLSPQERDQLFSYYAGQNLSRK